MMHRKSLIGIAVATLAALVVSANAQDKNDAPKSPPAKTGSAGALLNLPYVSGGHAQQKLDLYLPGTGGKTPVVVWIHPGFWRGGSKDNCPALIMLPKGFAVVSINYRFSQHAPFPAQIEDCKAAIRWLRANASKYNLDPDRIGVWGASSGGYLAAMLGTTGDVKEFDTGENLKFSSRVQAVLDWYGPVDFSKMDTTLTEEKSDAPKSPEAKATTLKSPEEALIGGPIKNNKEKVARANPISYITKDDPPFLILHADRDPTVPYNQSELLMAALRKARVPVKLQSISGDTHGGVPFTSPGVQDSTVAFFEKYLKKAE